MVIFVNILSCFFTFSNDMEFLEFCMVFVTLSYMLFLIYNIQFVKHIEGLFVALY